MYYNQNKNSRFVVTDLAWLADLIYEINSAEFKENFPVWTITSLKEKLNSKLKVDVSVATDLISYLCDMNLVALSNTPKSDLVLSINQIVSDLSEDQLVSRNLMFQSHSRKMTFNTNFTEKRLAESLERS